jgi:hypothetical protein
MGVEVVIPAKLSNITSVGQFQQLVMLSESNSQLRKVVSGKKAGRAVLLLRRRCLVQ